METIYLKIKINKSDIEANAIRNEGLFFYNIAEAISVDSEQIVEIDETNYLKEIQLIKKQYNDKS